VKDPGSALGFVDGAWWPYSRDLATELPALLAALEERVGTAERVNYHLGSWGNDGPPRRLPVKGRTVKLSGYRTMNAATIDVVGARRRLTMLVLPPDSTAEAATSALDLAARHDNIDTIAKLLAQAARHS
jgi:hypothetical protein